MAQIAKKSGYNSVQSFSRAFNQAYGIPPARYRKQGSHNQFNISVHNEHTFDGDATMYQVECKQLSEMELIGIPHKGSYMQVGQGFESLFAWLGLNNLISEQTRAIGIYFDDPDIVPEAELTSAACVHMPSANTVGLADNIEGFTLASGEYAVIRHIGPYANLRGVYQWFCRHWLPESGREFADGPVFEEYLNNAREVAPAELVTDIYLPLKPIS